MARLFTSLLWTCDSLKDLKNDETKLRVIGVLNVLGDGDIPGKAPGTTYKNAVEVYQQLYEPDKECTNKKLTIDHFTCRSVISIAEACRQLDPSTYQTFVKHALGHVITSFNKTVSDNIPKVGYEERLTTYINNHICTKEVLLSLELESRGGTVPDDMQIMINILKEQYINDMFVDVLPAVSSSPFYEKGHRLERDVSTGSASSSASSDGKDTFTQSRASTALQRMNAYKLFKTPNARKAYREWVSIIKKGRTDKKYINTIQKCAQYYTEDLNTFIAAMKAAGEAAREAAVDATRKAGEAVEEAEKALKQVIADGITSWSKRVKLIQSVVVTLVNFYNSVPTPTASESTTVPDHQPLEGTITFADANVIEKNPAHTLFATFHNCNTTTAKTASVCMLNWEKNADGSFRLKIAESLYDTKTAMYASVYKVNDEDKNTSTVVYSAEPSPHILWLLFMSVYLFGAPTVVFPGIIDITPLKDINLPKLRQLESKVSPSAEDPGQVLRNLATTVLKNELISDEGTFKQSTAPYPTKVELADIYTFLKSGTTYYECDTFTDDNVTSVYEGLKKVGTTVEEWKVILDAHKGHSKTRTEWNALQSTIDLKKHCGFIYKILCKIVANQNILLKTNENAKSTTSTQTVPSSKTFNGQTGGGGGGTRGVLFGGGINYAQIQWNLVPSQRSDVMYGGNGCTWDTYKMLVAIKARLAHTLSSDDVDKLTKWIEYAQNICIQTNNLLKHLERVSRLSQGSVENRAILKGIGLLPADHHISSTDYNQFKAQEKKLSDAIVKLQTKAERVKIVFAGFPMYGYP